MSKIIELKNVNKWFDKFQALKDFSPSTIPLKDASDRASKSG